MKRIIDGKMYNTETATCVASYSNGYGSGDFKVIDEDIYIKKTGEWFLEGHGGAMTEYAEPDGNGMCGSRKIIPYTDLMAKQWLLEHNFVDEYIKYFGEPEE